jgi:hypothetical protein
MRVVQVGRGADLVVLVGWIRATDCEPGKGDDDTSNDEQRPVPHSPLRAGAALRKIHPDIEIPEAAKIFPQPKPNVTFLIPRGFPSNVVCFVFLL